MEYTALLSVLGSMLMAVRAEMNDTFNISTTYDSLNMTITSDIPDVDEPAELPAWLQHIVDCISWYGVIGVLVGFVLCCCCLLLGCCCVVRKRRESGSRSLYEYYSGTHIHTNTTQNRILLLVCPCSDIEV